INTLTTLVAIAVAGLGWVHFQESGDAAPLLRASAFLTLAGVTALSLGVTAAGIGLAFGLDTSQPGQLPVLATILDRGVASALLLLAGFAGLRRWQATRWPALLILWLPALTVVALVAIGAAIQDSLPRLLGPAELTALRNDPTAPLVVFGARALLGFQVAIGLAYLVAALLEYRTYRRDGRSLDAFLAAGLVIAAFSQVQSAIHPGVYTGLVTLGDLERVAFYGVLLLALAAERREEVRALRRANAELVVLREADVARATADERARLAREIHDGMSQELWFAKLKQERLASMELPPAARALATEVAGALEAALSEARQAILALRPTEGVSFAEVLEGFVADFSDRFGILAECSCDAAANAISPRNQAELLRIAQEALTNARRHADPTLVRVSVDVGDGTLRLVVSDNGRGFDGDLVRTSGYGLRSMRERAELIGGRLTIETGIQDGTRVRVEVPMEAAR
ncbi:MAG: sensor histidine kinase, partial [Chloroflexota bacterium]|nr:sensor histidine kinase [Chloroflexota bacterium]